jgi:cytochrome c oxidase cbb3-type subunit 3
MARRSGGHAIGWLVVGAVLLGACERERRETTSAPTAVNEPARGSRLNPNHVGSDDTTLFTPASSPMVALGRAYERRAYDLNEGKRLFSAYNCSGCHANGGGGMGPALMDSVWLYGNQPLDIFQSIVRGRPNGMPSFSGRLSQQQAWQLVAYVRSMSGSASATAAPGRTEDMDVTRRPENSRSLEPPVDSKTGRRKGGR